MAASYFSVSQYGNAGDVYPGAINAPQDPRNIAMGIASAFLAGMVGPGVFGNLPAKEVRLYGAFNPGVVKANTLLSAFPILQGPFPRLAPFANIERNTGQGRFVPPYGNAFVFS